MAVARSYGELLRARREAAGVSLRVLAKHIGLSFTYLSEVERGKRWPLRHPYTDAACEFLGCTSTLLRRAAERGVIECWRNDARTRAKGDDG